MGFIAALLSTTGADISAQISLMLKVASPNPGDGCGIATPDGVMLFHSLPDSLILRSGIALGHKLVKAMPNDPPQPVTQHGYAMIFDGRLRRSSGSPDLSMAVDLMGENPARGILRLIEEEDGSYAVAVAEKGRILCGRDPIGVVPLYLGASGKILGAASNRKMLWSAGLEAEPLPPGCMAELTEGGMRMRRIRSLSQPPVRGMSMEKAVRLLDVLLSEAVEARTRGVVKASLGFSGGIDSSLLAHYLDRHSVDLDLVCVGVEGSEFEAAEEAAEGIGLPLRLESFTELDVEADLDEVLCSVEEANPMKVAVALPLRWAARSAASHGSRIFYSGNGSDELFGGYLRYIREHADAGEVVKDTMFRDVAEAHTVNYERDYKVCADAGVELRLPYADDRLIDFGLTLPLGLRLPTKEDSPRKPLLRALASRIGLPETVAFKRKRAIQYSTGVSEVLIGLARRKGTSMARYLSDRFDRVRDGCIKIRSPQ